MDQEKREPEPRETSSEKENGGYSFMKQTIKKRTVSKRSLLLRALAVIVFAAIFGVVAAFVFAAMRPVAETAVHGTPEDPRVSIPADEEPETSQTSSASSVSESSVSGSSANTESSSSEPEPTEAPAEPTPEPAPVPEVPASGITLEQYRQLQMDMVAVADQAAPFIVQVAGISNELDYFLQDHESRMTATGLVIARTGSDIFILTDEEAAAGAEEIAITFSDGSMEHAELVRVDSGTGLAVIRASIEELGEELTAAFEEITLGNSNTARRGEPVLLLGSPKGYEEAVVCGMLTSTTTRIPCVDGEIQVLSTDIDAAGETSGVLVDLSGNIIGMITRRVAGEGGETVSAYAISRIKPLIERLSNNEPTNYAGLRGQTVTNEISRLSGIPRGFLVTSVDPDSPAMLAGIKELDVITEVGGASVSTVDGFTQALSSQTAGTQVEVKAMRQGADGYAEVSFQLTPGER